MSTSGSANVIARVQLTSEDAAKFVDAAGTFTCKVYHDIGSSTNFIATIYKADAKDDFSSITSVQAGDATAVADQTVTTVTVSKADLGDVSNGIEIQISAAVGTITTKNIRISEAKFEAGGTASGFSEYPYRVEKAALGVGDNIPVQVYSADVSAGANIDALAAISDNTGYNYYRFIFENIKYTTGAASNEIRMRIADDGATPLTAGSYIYFLDTRAGSGASPSYANSTTSTYFLLDGAFFKNNEANIVIDFEFPNTSGQYVINATVKEESGSSFCQMTGKYNSDITPSGVRLYMSVDSWDAAGTVRVLASNNPF